MWLGLSYLEKWNPMNSALESKFLKQNGNKCVYILIKYQNKIKLIVYCNLRWHS